MRQQNGENEAFGKFFMEEKAMQHDSPAQLAPLDRQAFQSFYQENLGPIYRYVYSKVGNREEAEDLTSHVKPSVASIMRVTHKVHAVGCFKSRVPRSLTIGEPTIVQRQARWMRC